MESNHPGPFIKSAFAPAVLVVANQEVDEACKKNGVDFTLSVLLEACRSTVPPTREPVKVRVSADSQNVGTVVLKSMDVKFLTPVNYGAQRPKFQFLLLPPAQVEHFPVISDAKSITTYQNRYVSSNESSGPSSRMTPWFDEYRTKFFQSLGPSAFEQFEHPIVCLVVTTSNDINPVDTLQRLFDRKATSLQNGMPRYVDTTAMTFFYVLLHDASSTIPPTDATKKFALVEKQWPGQSAMITINSLPNSELSEDYNRKVLLSPSDMDSVKRLIRTVVWNNMIPHMERMVQSIFPEVSKERSGLMHKFNLMWGSRFSRKVDENDPDGLLFEMNSLEFRERRLADWSFMLGEYTVAYKTFLSLADIYKSDGSAVPIAGVYRASALEMAANSLGMMATNNANLGTPQQWNEMEKLFSESWDLYQRGRRRTWARRSALTHAYWAQIRLQAGSASAIDRLINDSNDQLEMALLYQQKAISFVLRSPSRLRNYAFEFVKAADAFTAGHQFLHAICCYYTAHSVYEGKNWSGVNDYLHFRIARLAIVVNRPDLAMRFITELIKDNKQAGHLQNSYLREYLYVFRTYGAQLPSSLAASQCLPTNLASSIHPSALDSLTNLPIAPVPVLTRKVKIHVLDVSGGPSQSPPEWQALESSVIEIMTPPEKRYLLTLKKPAAKVEHLGVVGENIYVDVEITNPLQVPLQFTDMSLTCQLTPSYSAMASGMARRPSKPIERNSAAASGGAASAASSAPVQASSSSVPSSENAARSVPAIQATQPQGQENSQEPPPMWFAEKFDKFFAPGETRVVQFPVKPLVEGSLSILGLSFKLCGTMDAFRPLVKPQVIKVSLPMPRVEISLHGLPGTQEGTSSALYVGQHHPTTLRIKNTGQKPLTNLAFTTSHPQVFLSSELEEDLSIPHKWGARIRLREPLWPDQHVDVPIVLRPTTEGTQSYQLLVYYEPASAVSTFSLTGPSSSSQNSEIKYRMTRATVTLKVVKSLRLNATIRPDPLAVNRYIMTVDIDNQTKAKTKSGAILAVRALRLSSHNWRPTLLDPVTGEPYKDMTTRAVLAKTPLSAFEQNFGEMRNLALPSPDSPGPDTPASSVPGSPTSVRSTNDYPSHDSSSMPSPSRNASRTPPSNKLSMYSTTAASSYAESSCMKPDTMETSLGSSVVPTVLPPRHATTLLFRLERKNPDDQDVGIVNSNITFSHASSPAQQSMQQVPGVPNAAAFLAQESIIARRNAAPKRSALFDRSTPEELEEAKRIHDINTLHNVSLLVTWEIAHEASSALSSASLSALTLSASSQGGSSLSSSLPANGTGNRQVIASLNVFDIPFVPTAPWVGHDPNVSPTAANSSGGAAASSSTSSAAVTPENREEKLLQAQLGLYPGAPVQIVLDHASLVRHSFSAQPVAFVPIVFHLFNTSPFTALKLTFEALKPSEQLAISKTYVGASGVGSAAWKSSSTKRRNLAEEGRSQFMWVGRTSHEIAVLEPETMTHFSLQVCFPFDGKFNLNRWRFWVAPANCPSRKIPVYARAQHYIHILDDPNAPPTIPFAALTNSRLGSSLLSQSLNPGSVYDNGASHLGQSLLESHTDFLRSQAQNEGLASARFMDEPSSPLPSSSSLPSILVSMDATSPAASEPTLDTSDPTSLLLDTSISVSDNDGSEELISASPAIGDSQFAVANNHAEGGLNGTIHESIDLSTEDLSVTSGDSALPSIVPDLVIDEALNSSTAPETVESETVESETV